jgi:hypothetical protein
VLLGEGAAASDAICAWVRYGSLYVTTNFHNTDLFNTE